MWEALSSAFFSHLVFERNLANEPLPGGVKSRGLPHEIRVQILALDYLGHFIGGRESFVV